MGKTACAVGAIQMNPPPKGWRKNRAYQTLRARDHLCEPLWAARRAVPAGLPGPRAGPVVLGWGALSAHMRGVAGFPGASAGSQCAGRRRVAPACSLRHQQHAPRWHARRHAPNPHRPVVSPAATLAAHPTMPPPPPPRWRCPLGLRRRSGRRCSPPASLPAAAGVAHVLAACLAAAWLPPGATWSPPRLCLGGCREQEIHKTTDQELSILKWTENKGRQLDCKLIAEYDVVRTHQKLNIK